MRVFSADPGVCNLGIAVLNNGEIEYADKVALFASLKELKSIGQHSLIKRVQQKFFTQGNKLSDLLLSSDIVVIEIQMSKRMLLVQYVMGTLCEAHGKAFAFVSPRSVKVHFGTGKKARRGTSKAVKGTIKNYKANKRTAIDKASELFPTFMSNVTTSKKDDVADALLQAVYTLFKIDQAKSKSSN